MQLGIELTGDRAAILRFEQFPKFAHDRLLATMQSLETRLEAAVLADLPSKNSKGALRSLIGGKVYDHGARIAVVVGVRAQNASDAKKAAALEFGSHKSLTVRAHRASLAHFWARAVAPIMVDVGTHSRTPNIEAFRFLRGPLEAMRSQAIAEMRAAVEAAVDDASK